MPTSFASKDRESENRRRVNPKRFSSDENRSNVLCAAIALAGMQLAEIGWFGAAVGVVLLASPLWLSQQADIVSRRASRLIELCRSMILVPVGLFWTPISIFEINQQLQYRLLVFNMLSVMLMAGMAGLIVVAAALPKIASGE